MNLDTMTAALEQIEATDPVDVYGRRKGVVVAAMMPDGFVAFRKLDDGTIRWEVWSLYKCGHKSAGRINGPLAARA